MAPTHAACKNNDVSEVKRLLDQDDSLKDLEIDDGITPLMYCAVFGSLECLKLLRERGADVNRKNNYGGSAAHYAAANGKLECLQYLVEHCGADVTMKNNNGETPLDKARERGQQSCVEYLAEGVSKHGTPKPTAPPPAAPAQTSTASAAAVDRPASATKRLPTPRKLGAKPMGDWDEDECIAFLKAVCRYSEYEDKFRSEGIRGSQLLLMDHEMLKDDLGIEKKLHRSTILDNIAKMKPASSAPTPAVTAAVEAVTAAAAAPPATDGGSSTAAPEYDLKFALVIGNQNYDKRPLQNSRKDATDVAEALEERGFTVFKEFDADKPKMKKVFRHFIDALKTAGTVETVEAGRGGVVKKKITKPPGPSRSVFAVVFYAGHGHEMQGTNYLVGVHNDFNANDTEDIKDGSLPLQHVTAEIDKAREEANTKQLSLIILDACRDDPIKAARGGEGGGLTPDNAPSGCILCYACAPGKTAADGKPGENGVFTKCLLESLRGKDKKPIPVMLTEVANGVKKASKGEQIPWKADCVTDTIYYNTVM